MKFGFENIEADNVKKPKSFPSVGNLEYFEEKREKGEFESYEVLDGKLNVSLEWKYQEGQTIFENQEERIKISYQQKALNLMQDKVFLENIKRYFRNPVTLEQAAEKFEKYSFDSLVIKGLPLQDLFKEYSFFTLKNKAKNVEPHINRKEKYIFLGNGIESFLDLFKFMHEIGHYVSRLSAEDEYQGDDLAKIKMASMRRHLALMLKETLEDKSIEEKNKYIQNVGIHLNDERNASAFALRNLRGLAKSLKIDQRALLQLTHKALKSYSDESQELV